MPDILLTNHVIDLDSRYCRVSCCWPTGVMLGQASVQQGVDDLPAYNVSRSLHCQVYRYNQLYHVASTHYTCTDRQTRTN